MWKLFGRSSLNMSKCRGMASILYNNELNLGIFLFSRHDLFTIVELPEGVHQYKYFVDGQWVCDEKEVGEIEFQHCLNACYSKFNNF